MSRREPAVGEWYLHDNKAYKVVFVSRGTDDIILFDLASGKKFQVLYSTFKYGFERAFKVGAVAKMIGRSPRSIYRYESAGVIEKAKRYADHMGRGIRLYTKQDILDIHEMVSEIHAGRPRKDKRVVSNLPSRAELLIDFRERFGE